MTVAELIQAIMLIVAFIMQFVVLIINCGAL